MFTLRRIDKEFGQINTKLGDYYSLVLKEQNPKQFKEATKDWDGELVDKAYGVIIYDDPNGYIMALYSGSQYYIMTSGGETFDNISRW